MTHKPALVHVLHDLATGAIPHIVRDIQPSLAAHFDVHVITLDSTPPSQDLLRQLQALSVTVHQLCTPRRAAWTAYLRLQDLLRRISPTIVHAHLSRADILSTLARPRGSKLVATFHSVREGYHPLMRVALEFLSPNVDCRTCVSATVARTWRVRGRKEVVYNPVRDMRSTDPARDRQDIRRELGLAANDRLVLNVGRLVPAKNQEILIAATGKAQEITHHPLVLAIAGEGPERLRLEEAARRTANIRVRLLGVRPDIDRLLAATDVFAFPSRWEGLGIAVLEAMSASVPVVVSDAPALRELVEPGVTGLSAPHNDANAIGHQLAATLNNPEMSGRMALSAKLLTDDKFSPIEIGNLYLSIYQSVMEEQ